MKFVEGTLGHEQCPAGRQGRAAPWRVRRRRRSEAVEAGEPRGRGEAVKTPPPRARRRDDPRRAAAQEKEIIEYAAPRRTTR